MNILKNGLTANGNAVSEVCIGNTNFVIFQDCESERVLSMQTGELWFEPLIPNFDTILPTLTIEKVNSWATSVLAVAHKDCASAQYCQPCNIEAEFPHLELTEISKFVAAVKALELTDRRQS